MIIRILSCSLLTVGALGALELALRLAGYAALTSNLSHYQRDPQLGWVTVPGQVAYRSTWAYGHFTRLDEEGEPVTASGEPRREKQEPLTVLLGDSFLEGFYVPYEQSIAFLLAREFPGGGFRNLGVAGYSPEQILLSARRVLPGRRVARTLTFFYAYNDVPYVDQPYLYQGMYAKPVLTPDLRPLPLAQEPSGPPPGRHLALLSVALPFLGHFLPRFALPGLPAGSREGPALAERGLARALQILGAVGREFPSPCSPVIYIPAYAEFEAATLAANGASFRAECARQHLRCLWPEGFATDPGWRSFYQEMDNQKHFSAAGSRRFFEVIQAALRDWPGCPA